jgi:methionine-rich copper-binding protein CopC
MTHHLRPAAVLLLILLAGAVQLTAHLSVVKTSPAHDSAVEKAPAVVRVWFSQQPSARISRLELSGPRGAVPLGDLVTDEKERSIAAPIQGTLAPGRYEVTWRTAGDDGHVQRGTFSFTLAGS